MKLENDDEGSEVDAAGDEILPSLEFERYRIRLASQR